MKDAPVLVRTDAYLDFDWGEGSPDKSINDDNFSARWTGTIVPEVSGEYTLVVKVNNCFRLFIDEKPVLDNWPSQPPTIKKTNFTFAAGKEYHFRIEFYEHLGTAEFHLSWIAPGSIDKYKKELQDKLNAELVKAKEIIAKSDAVVFAGGLSPDLEGEEMEVWVEGFLGGDRTNIELPEVQKTFLKEISKMGKPVIFVLMNGSALAINWEKENLPAIVEAWYAGEEGGNAITDVLTGDYNPAGRLPVTFYKSANDLPSFEDYNMSGRTYRYFKGQAIYPFGYGLSYTKFEYSGLKLNKNNINTKDSITVSVHIKNTGNFNGDEVVQLYVKNTSSKLPQPNKDLRGFKRINIKKGETQTVQFTLKADAFKYFDEKKDDFIIEPGKYEIQIGASSDDIRLKEILQIE